MDVIHIVISAVWKYIVANPVIVVTAVTALVGLGAACYRMQAAWDEKTKAALERLNISVEAFADLQGIVQLDVTSHSPTVIPMDVDLVEEISRLGRFKRVVLGIETVVDAVDMEEKFRSPKQLDAMGHINFSAMISTAKARTFSARWFWPLCIRIIAGNDPMVIPVKWEKGLAKKQ